MSHRLPLPSPFSQVRNPYRSESAPAFSPVEKGLGPKQGKYCTSRRLGQDLTCLGPARESRRGEPHPEKAGEPMHSGLASGFT